MFPTEKCSRPRSQSSAVTAGTNGADARLSQRRRHMPLLEYIDERNPVQRVNNAVLSRLVRAQHEDFRKVFPTAADLLRRAIEESKINIDIPANLSSSAATALADLT